jgi:P-type Ca2+ transporter type 2C
MLAVVPEPTADAAEAGDWYRLTADEACRRLGVDPAVGLDDAEVAERRARYGPNKLAEEAKEPAWHAFLRQYRDLMQLVLIGAAVVSIVALQDVSTGLVVFGLTVLNAVMGLNQEGKAAESVAALRQMLIITASVRRGGEVHEVPAEDLVPGDIVSFEAGDKVPADGRLLVAATLEIEEAGLTGESTPVAKSLEPVSGEDVSLGDRVDMAYMNSQVTRGRGEMVVTATGMASEVGHISGMLSGVEQEKTPLTRSLLHVAAALEWRDPRESIFRRETVANGRFNLLTLAAVALTLLVTTVPLLQRIFDTVDLDGHQWRACLVAVAAYLALTEAAKFVLRRIDPEGA